MDHAHAMALAVQCFILFEGPIATVAALHEGLSWGKLSDVSER